MFILDQNTPILLILKIKKLKINKYVICTLLVYHKKVTFPVTSKPTPPTVFNLQASERLGSL